MSYGTTVTAPISATCSKRPRACSSARSTRRARSSIASKIRPTHGSRRRSTLLGSHAAHVAYLDGNVTAAKAIVLEVFDDDPFAPDVWDAFARLCADTDFDPAPFVTRCRTTRPSTCSPRSAARPPRASTASPISSGPATPATRACSRSCRRSPPASTACARWSGRRACVRPAWAGCAPCWPRAEDVRVGATERARAAALAHASFGDRRARECLERAVPELTDDELMDTLREVWAIAADAGRQRGGAGRNNPARVR